MTPWDTKKKAPKKKSSSIKTPTKKTKASVESGRAKKVKLLIIGVLWVGAYLLIDSGLIDIGWKPPFSLLKKKDATHSDVFTLPAQVVPK